MVISADRNLFVAVNLRFTATYAYLYNFCGASSTLPLKYVRVCNLQMFQPLTSIRNLRHSAQERLHPLPQGERARQKQLLGSPDLHFYRVEWLFPAMTSRDSPDKINTFTPENGCNIATYSCKYLRLNEYV